MGIGSNFKVIFLFGAGISIPAGLPDISKMTTDFINSQDGRYRKKVNDLIAVAGLYFERQDIESLLSLLHRLKDKKDQIMFKSMYSQISEVEDADISSLIISTQKFIREKLENIQSTDYISNLRYLTFVPEVFTLNYDSVIENILESGNIEYTDGFGPFWNPSLFDNESAKFKLYKLHGSLYWFTTPMGKMIKVPIKGLDVSKIKYITGEELTEVLIYPTIQKEKFSRLYDFLGFTFTDKLSKANLCVVIGYSYRDKDITEKIRESIKTNNDLWILTISRNAQKSIENLSINILDESKSRIGYINTGIGEVLDGLKLMQHIEDLSRCINREKEIWNTVNYSSLDRLDKTRLESNLSEVFHGYVTFGLKQRCQLLLSRLLKENKIPKETYTKMEGMLSAN